MQAHRLLGLLLDEVSPRVVPRLPTVRVGSFGVFLCESHDLSLSSFRCSLKMRSKNLCLMLNFDDMMVWLGGLGIWE